MVPQRKTATIIHAESDYSAIFLSALSTFEILLSSKTLRKSRVIAERGLNLL